MELQTATAYTTRFNVLFASLSVNYLVLIAKIIVLWYGFQIFET